MLNKQKVALANKGILLVALAVGVLYLLFLTVDTIDDAFGGWAGWSFLVAIWATAAWALMYWTTPDEEQNSSSGPS